MTREDFQIEIERGAFWCAYEIAKRESDDGVPVSITEMQKIIETEFRRRFDVSDLPNQHNEGTGSHERPRTALGASC